MRALLIGCGKFGSWWLSGLTKTGIFKKIYVVDKSFENFNKALKKNTIDNQESKVEIIYCNSINKVDKDQTFDISVVCVNSDIRLNIIKNLIKSNLKVSKIVLEKVLVQNADHLQKLVSLLKGKQTFINYNMRYQPIVSDFNYPTFLMVDGGKYDLASNCFHYIDFAEFIFREPIKDINFGLSESNWFNSLVRPNYQTFYGTIFGNFSLSKILLSWKKNEVAKLIIYQSDKSIIEINEISKEINFISSKGEKNLSDQKWLDFSEMSIQIINDILFDKSLLPDIESVFNHTSLILEGLSKIYFSNKNNYLTSEKLINKFLPIT